MKKKTLALGFLFLTASACTKTSTDQSIESSKRRRPIGVYYVTPTGMGARASGTTVSESSSDYRGYVDEKEAEQKIRSVSLTVKSTMSRSLASELPPVELLVENSPDLRRELAAALKNQGNLEKSEHPLIFKQLRTKVPNIGDNVSVKITMFFADPLKLYTAEGKLIAVPEVKPRAKVK